MSHGPRARRSEPQSNSHDVRLTRPPANVPGEPLGDDEKSQFDWARQRLWLLVVAALMAISPQISPQYGPYVALGLILVSHFPTPRSLREFFQSETAAG